MWAQRRERGRKEKSGEGEKGLQKTSAGFWRELRVVVYNGNMSASMAF